MLTWYGNPLLFSNLLAFVRDFLSAKFKKYSILPGCVLDLREISSRSMQLFQSFILTSIQPFLVTKLVRREVRLDVAINITGQLTAENKNKRISFFIKKKTRLEHFPLKRHLNAFRTGNGRLIKRRVSSANNLLARVTLRFTVYVYLLFYIDTFSLISSHYFLKKREWEKSSLGASSSVV